MSDELIEKVKQMIIDSLRIEGMSTDQIDALQMRTRQWHEWDHSRPGRYRSAWVGGQTDLSHYDPACPLLVEGACLAYPARPVVCRHGRDGTERAGPGWWGRAPRSPGSAPTTSAL